MEKKNMDAAPRPTEKRAMRTAAVRAAPRIQRLLLAAYDAGKRKLPWRGETDPYRIWVSEVMLQQTRVETVIPYYGKWMERFPTVEALAEAEEEEVLRMWQGLGYYSRARRLHEGARLVRERFGGVLPQRSEELEELPGVGEYTAGAVASIAFGEPVPAVDGNVRRVLARLFDLPSPQRAQLRSLAAGLVDRSRPGDFNQALMELGALTCVPRAPRCEDCPLASECLALARGTVYQRPLRKARKPVPEVALGVLVAIAPTGSGEWAFLMRRRPDTGLLAGMWEFPGVEVSDDVVGISQVLEAVSGLAQGLGLDPVSDAAAEPPEPSELPVVDHAFSHLRVRYYPFLFRILPATPCPDCAWVAKTRLPEVPLPVAQLKIAEAAMELLPR
jgi:A/G-specific adenine glycosylase